jgi:hypothetical protein
MMISSLAGLPANVAGKLLLRILGEQMSVDCFQCSKQSNICGRDQTSRFPSVGKHCQPFALRPEPVISEEAYGGRCRQLSAKVDSIERSNSFPFLMEGFHGIMMQCYIGSIDAM